METATDTSYTATVLPMRSLGAPMGVVVLRDVEPTAPLCKLQERIKHRLQRSALRRVGYARVLLYRANLTLETFPDQTNWRFLSTTPFSQLLRRLNYPLPIAES
jgi:hypothetical protein